MTEIIKMNASEVSAQINGPNWTVDVVKATGYTGCWYARTKTKSEKRYISVTCGSRDLAAEEAVKFVYENIWENL